jgi:hypothetical protein
LASDRPSCRRPFGLPSKVSTCASTFGTDGAEDESVTGDEKETGSNGTLIGGSADGSSDGSNEGRPNEGFNEGSNEGPNEGMIARRAVVASRCCGAAD